MDKKRAPIAAVVVLLIGLPLLAYWSLWTATFINFDDYQYLQNNPVIAKGLTWRGIAYAFTNFTLSNWHPITWLSHMVDFNLFGPVPGAHHMVNVVVHALASVALFAFLTRLPLSRGQAAFVALVFALHPLQVESVAWASQRKATLSALFGFLSLFTWTAFLRSDKQAHFWTAVVFFAMSLMSKSAFMTLPAVMVLLDLILLNRFAAPGEEAERPLRRLGLSLQEKWPFWLLTCAGGVMTVVSAMTKDGNALALNRTMPHAWRLLNAMRAYAAYLRDFLVPKDFAVFYPMNEHSPETARSLLCLGLLAALSLVVWRYRRTRPFLFFGWLWFLGVLLPMSGVIQTGFHARANRFMYLPIVGLALMVAAGIDWSWLKRARIPSAAVLVLLMTVGTAHQARYWQNDMTLFTYSTKKVPSSQFNLMLALNLFKQNRKAEGMAEIERFYPAMIATPQYILPTADTMAKFDALEEARALMARAAEDIPEAAEVWTARARLLDPEDKDTRLDYLHRALAADPKFGPANYLLGKFLMAEGQYTEALRPMVLAQNAEDRSPDTGYQLGLIYEQLGNPTMAYKMLEKQLKATPGHIPTLHALGTLSIKRGDSQSAVTYFEKVYKRNPEYLKSPHLFALAYGNLGRFEEAADVLHAALARDPDDTECRLLLGKAMEFLKKPEEALEAYRYVLKQHPENETALSGVNRLGATP